MIKIKTQGRKAPIFFIHPGDGHLFCYHPLFQRIDIDHPIYGFQAHGTQEGTLPLSGIEAIAKSYARIIEDIVPDEAIFLVGFCAGGTIAYEMMQQLNARQKRVKRLILIDTFAPGLFGRKHTDEKLLIDFLRDFGGLSNTNLLPAYCHMRGIEPSVEHIQKDASNLTASEMLSIIFESARRSGIFNEDLGIADLRRIFNVYDGLNKAISNYRIKPSAEEVLLIKAQNNVLGQKKAEQTLSQGWLRNDIGQVILSHPDLGWQSYCPNLIVEEVAGNHFTMLGDPHVSGLAMCLNTWIKAHQFRDLAAA